MYSGSALVDLKAELSRKEDELQQVKDSKQGSGKGSKTFAKIQEVIGKKKKHKKKYEGKPGKEPSRCDEVPDETLQLLQKARHKLEAKAKIYEKMQKGEMEDVENMHGETRYLVDFQHKYYTEVDDEDKWLSRTPLESPSTPNTSSASLFEVNESHREKMREKWEKEQEELLEGPVHYEHVKFDEVRDLGTGYFAFSKDEEERKKQLEELKDLREQTKTAHDKKELLRNKRKAALENRLDKVKRRKLGYTETEIGEAKVSSGDEKPPSSQNSDKDDESNNPDDSTEKNDQMVSYDSSTLSVDDDKMLQSCRKQSQQEREWDKGKKSGFLNQIFIKSKEPPLYEKIIDERRDERDDQFAPPNSY